MVQELFVRCIPGKVDGGVERGWNCLQFLSVCIISNKIGLFDDETVFTDSNVYCYYKVNTPNDLDSYGPDSETFCYNVPNDSTRLFAS